MAAAALIGAGASLIGGLFRRGAERRAERRNIRFWEMQNAYNHPKEQMKRLQEAGLNPNLIYGTPSSSSVGNASNIAPAKSAKWDFQNPINDLLMSQNIRQSKAQTDNFITHNTVLQQEAALKANQAAGKAIDNASSYLDYKRAKETFSESMDAIKESLRRQKLNNEISEIDLYVKDKGKADQVKRIKAEADWAKENLNGQRLINYLRALEADYKRIGIEKNDHILFRLFGRHLETVRKRIDKPFLYR